MGRSSYSSKCGRCTDPDCNGHNGFIDLGEFGKPDYIDPFLNPAAGFIVRDLYNILCNNCASLIVTPSEIERAKLTKMPIAKKIKSIFQLLESKLKNQTAHCLKSNKKFQSEELVSDCQLPTPQGGLAKYDKKTNEISIGSTIVSDFNPL